MTDRTVNEHDDARGWLARVGGWLAAPARWTRLIACVAVLLIVGLLTTVGALSSWRSYGDTWRERAGVVEYDRDRLVSEVEPLRADLADLAAEVDRLERQLERQREAAATFEEDLREEYEEEFASRDEELDDRERELDERDTELDDREETLARREQEVASSNDAGRSGGSDGAETQPTPNTSEQQGVHPGAFGSPQGATGRTSAGTPMKCTTTEEDSRARWRRR